MTDWPSFSVDDPLADSPYVQRYEQEIGASRWLPSREADLLAAAKRADVVLCGEYHPLPTACEVAQLLLTHAGPRNVKLGLEMVHTRDQAALDAFAGGAIGSREFKQRIRYDEEWGYPFAAPLELLRHARNASVPVVGLDLPPRGSLESLALRDRVVAERIAHDADAFWIVVFGEAHVAREHLPAQIAAMASICGRSLEVLRVVCDAPQVPRASEWMRADETLFCAPRRTPEQRERALARVYRQWAADESVERIDTALVAHELIDTMAYSIHCDPRRRRVGPARYLADTYPEVFAPTQLVRARRRLRELRRHAGPEVRADWSVPAHWVEHANVLVVSQVELSSLALECARFLVAALATVELGAVEALAAALALARSLDPSVRLTERAEYEAAGFDAETVPREGGGWPRTRTRVAAGWWARSLFERERLDADRVNGLLAGKSSLKREVRVG